MRLLRITLETDVLSLEFQNEKERKTFSNDFPAKHVRFPENIISDLLISWNFG